MTQISITHWSALQLIRDLLQKADIQGLREMACKSYILAKYERVWDKVECTLKVQFDIKPGEISSNPELKASATINFPAGPRSLQETLDFLDLVIQVQDITQKIIFRLDTYKVYFSSQDVEDV